MIQLCCCMLAVSILPWIECARPSLAADLHPALTSDDTVFGSVVLSEGDEWSFQPGYVQGISDCCQEAVSDFDHCMLADRTT